MKEESRKPKVGSRKPETGGPKVEAGDKAEKGRKKISSGGASAYYEKYLKGSVPALMSQFGYKNRFEVPKLKKIVVNSCLKEAAQDKKILDLAAQEIAQVTGQKPMLTRARKAISNFKLKEGQPIGCVVTLRRKRMYEFMNRLVNVALPRVRDFKGVSPKAFDGRGGYTLGLQEQTIFPEIVYDKVERTTGMSLTFVTTAKTPDEAKALLKSMGMPFREA